MKLKDMFKKPIDRDIKGVIKVGQKEEENIRQELEEYVVTNELQRHFRDFFSAYSKGISTKTDDMGVWISGFFGSGKSHLLKILSYLLSNKEINGKKAIEYFLDDNKIKDEMVIADMRKAAQISTDAILFNIDSKSESSGTKGKDDILKVFLKVFNEMQGFSSNPFLSDLERELAENGKYEEFKKMFNEITGKEWITERNKFAFIKTKISDTLEKIGFMTKEETGHWIDTTKGEYFISIENFAKMVNRYIENKGNNHHVVFFVDEIGQYIGDNTDLMLNLQTVTEDLGIHCKGKAWVVVTSQQAIDSITKVKGNDFSKIQGRFKTRISLTSTDVSEVIKKRILDKNEYAGQELSLVYDAKESVIRNLIYFDDSAEKKIYENRNDFIDVYPFIPYQFQILSHVLTSIREHGASGKHLAEGERSMLALFKEGAERYKDSETGVLVSFDRFYDGLQSFLDHTHSIVINKAMDNSYINPEREADCFNVNVLKVLFMIKYVKEIKATLENITTLMVDNIDMDRISLKERVKEALVILEKQTLVQKSMDTYIFLTNEEQEVEKMIDKIDIDTNDILRKISEKIFDGLYSEKKYQHPEFNEYNFFFNQEIDDIPRGNNLHDIGINIVTGNSEYSGNESLLLMKSSQKNCVFIDLGEDNSYSREIEMDLKIEKFLKSGEADNLPQGDVIKLKKGTERREHSERASRLIEEALKNAKYYINGSRVTINAKDYKKGIAEALGKLVNIVFHKLSYITKSMSENDIRKLFEDKGNLIITSENISHNQNAITEITDHIKFVTKDRGAKITLKELKDKFQKAPYGFSVKDIEWIVAKGFKDGEIELKRNGNAITLLNESAEMIINYIIKKDDVERIYLGIKEKIDEKSIRAMNKVAKALFNETLIADDTDKMIKDFKELLKKKIEEIRNIENEYIRGNYPGKDMLEKGRKLLEKLERIKDSREVFNEVLGHADDYEDFSEDVEPIEKFFKGEQKNIWDNSIKLSKIYGNSKNYFTSEILEKISEEISRILNDKNPYNKIKDLPELNKKFEENYNEILLEKRKPVIEKIEELKDYSLEMVGNTEIQELKKEFTVEIEKEFSEIIEKVNKSQNIKDIEAFEKEASRLKDKKLDRFDKKLERMTEIQKEQNKDDSTEKETKIYTSIKKPKRMKIDAINKDRVWQITNEEEIENYLDKLRKKLKEELKNNEILHIEF